MDQLISTSLLIVLTIFVAVIAIASGYKYIQGTSEPVSFSNPVVYFDTSTSTSGMNTVVNYFYSINFMMYCRGDTAYSPSNIQSITLLFTDLKTGVVKKIVMNHGVSSVSLIYLNSPTRVQMTVLLSWHNILTNYLTCSKGTTQKTFELNARFTYRRGYNVHLEPVIKEIRVTYNNGYTVALTLPDTMVPIG